MIRGLFGPSSVSAMLRGGLEEASATHRVIADRVAGALSSSTTSDAPEGAPGGPGGKVSQADLERDMAALADTQLRYEAEAKLLQAAYGRLRSALRDRA
jgi:hypothetical protein